MPFGIHKHSNRSRQALNDQGHAAQGQGQGTAPSSIASSGDPSAFPPPPVFTHSGEQQQYQQGQVEGQTQQQQPHTPPLLQQPAFQQALPHPDSQPYQRRSPAQSPDFEQRPYPSAADLPSRSQSTRYSSAYPAPQQQHQVLRPQAAGSADDLSLDSRRVHQQPRAQPAPAPIPEQRKSKSIFERMRASSNRLSQSDPKSLPQGQYNNNTSGISRRLSKRQDNPPTIRTVPHQQRNSLDQQRVDWQPGPQDSRSHLPSPQEGNEDDSGLDPYLIRGPDQENIHRRSPQEGQGQQPTIHTVQSDSEPAPFHSTDEGRQQLQAQQLQNPQQHGTHHRSTSGSLINYELHNQSHHPQQQVNHHPGLIIHAPYQQQNAETVSQLSHDSPIEQREEQRPVSVHSNGQSPTTYQRPQFPDRSSSFQGPRPISQVVPAMAPPTGASQQNRRSADPKQSMQGPQGQPESREGPPPNYSSRVPSFQGNNQPATPGLSPMPSTASAQGSTYGGGPPQRDRYGPAAPGEQGRSTPPPQPASQDVEAAYKELQIKYKKVKGLYFDKTAQVEQLQNSLANQRLSQSRTSLDDSEYMTRFQRLDGATTNLAFNIRKDWNVVPAWLAPFTNQEAMKIGKQEMTAVGRACITKFLVDEIFNRTFHPGLEDGFSSSLKSIEQNIRRFSPALNNQEESDALTAKVVQWRLATLEGLKDTLSTAESEEYKKDFAQYVTSRLTANLITYLQEPVPAGIEVSAHMIVELAVSIASNLPLESRDISIVYPMPGDMLQPFIMKTEAGIPPLENPGVDTSSEIDAASTGSGDKEDSAKEGEKPEGGKLRKEKTKSTGGMLQAMMSGGSSAPSGKKLSVSSQGGQDGSSEGKVKASTEDGAQKVRFAGFVGVEVRGRQVLSKAPVWTIA
ncbi:hypothetical protein LSUB1_G007213 [Lachnellula subtilissima]|uniref:S-adenosylmethionine-dependent methyltransferase-like protein n=1 Tax=Lachnellula subtilissima TaxID=602034 RepID=A0A8H8RIN6_9HELO|nr:hypothetical protein LSUB1_G007213 [Lachnellula subtilissima]